MDNSKRQDQTRQQNDFGTLMNSWMEVAETFWRSMGKGGEETPSPGVGEYRFAAGGDDPEENRYKTYRAWETSVNNILSLMKILAAPQNQEQLTKGVMAFTEALIERAGETLENFAEFQGQLVKSYARIGEHTKAYNFDDLDRDAFESLRDLYRSEFQKYLHIPKIGLPREYHERVSELADKCTIFSSYLIELVYLFTVPFEKTNRVMQQKVKQMLETGDIAENSQQAYGEWIRILEGHYMELLKSPEYTEVLNNTITSLAAYKNVKNEVMDVFLKEYQIPTRRDMDEVYKDLYQMKKKIRELSRQVEQLQAALKESAVPSGA